MGHVRMDSPVSIRRAAVWLPLPVAIVLFLLNTGAAISGWLAPPAGYVGTMMLRAGDIALYMNWAHGFELHNLIPNYAAPWHTAPAFFNVFAWTLARLHQLTGVGIAVAYQLFHLLFYVLAAYALVFAARTFTKTATQFWAVFAVVCRLSAASARALLTDYGVRYVVVQDTSRARMYLGSAKQRAHIGSLLVYELETKGMQSYPGLRQLRSAAHTSVSPRRRIARG